MAMVGVRVRGRPELLFFVTREAGYYLIEWLRCASRKFTARLQFGFEFGFGFMFG
jgi:hypothetical protein